MKTMISSIILASCLALPLASCSDSDAAPRAERLVYHHLFLLC